jgi:hypothetical protein
VRNLWVAISVVAAAAGALTVWAARSGDPEALVRAACRTEIQRRGAAVGYSETAVGAFETAPADLGDFMGWADAPGAEAKDRAEIAADSDVGRVLQNLIDLHGQGAWTVARMSFVWRDAAGRHAARCAIVLPGQPLDLERIDLADIRLNGRTAAQDSLDRLDALSGQ